MKCEYCGKELNPGTETCSGCGAKVVNNNANQNIPTNQVEQNVNVTPVVQENTQKPKKGKGLIIVLVIIVILAIAGAAVYFIIGSKDENKKIEEPETTKPVGNELIGKVEKREGSEYALIVPTWAEYKGEKTFVYKVNDKFTVEYRDVEEGYEDSFNYTVYVNGKQILYDFNWEQEVLINVYDQNLLYVNTGTTDIRSESLYVVNVDGSFTEIYELDQNKGMVPNGFKFTDNEVIIGGSRTSHDLTVCYGDVPCGEGDENSIRFCVPSSYEAYGSDKLIVTADYIYKVEDGKVNLTPTITNEVTIGQYNQDNIETCERFAE